MLPTSALWDGSPRILSEDLQPPVEPLALLLRPGAVADAGAVVRRAARALLDLPEGPRASWPSWLAAHQRPAADRLAAILDRYGGALLADAVGLGKSYVALAVALARSEPFALVVPAVLAPQWRALLEQHNAAAPIITHESLSTRDYRHLLPFTAPYRLVVVDEAHRFRNPETRRYRALAKLVVGARVLLVTATPVHNRLADLFHLFRLFLRDHELTALGVTSLRRAAAGEVVPATLAAVAARLTVARSRDRVRAGYGRGPMALSFPQRAPGERVRAGVAPEPLLLACVAGAERLGTGGPAAPLLRITLLRRLASSLAAFRASLARHEAFLDLAFAAAQQGRVLDAHDFSRFCAVGDAGDAQLPLFAILLEPGARSARPDDLAMTRELRAIARAQEDPKADALAALLGKRSGKTIVFVEAAATVRHLLRCLRGRRVAGVVGETGLFAGDAGGRAEALRAFAPLAQGASPPPAALETDVLIATDLLSEGLNLQDAARVIHYDLPWSPARLAQRVGRIDRLGSPHDRVETITFLPHRAIERALAVERRLAAKVAAQQAAGAAQVESPSGQVSGAAGLDWCDRLQSLAARGEPPAPAGAYAVVRGHEPAVVLVVRIGGLVEALVVVGEATVADPPRATELLEAAASAKPAPCDPSVFSAAIRSAAGTVRERVASVAAARWRAGDRDRLARRLIPWVLAAGRRAARRRDAPELVRLDGLVSRLALGMTAGEEQLLEELLGRGAALAIGDVLAWHERLPPPREPPEAPRVELVAALAIGPAAPGQRSGVAEQ
jgi:hypothetical protein